MTRGLAGSQGDGRESMNLRNGDPAKLEAVLRDGDSV